ncbi:calponin homology domain-containing protein DDB_G0272472-like, partial [Vanessa cardui]|uniref:calponin homology domain-containing protein DDB_G0272472-like n=1 Tax=Vanessa cardui TaxID=171605 RepID=UPI001F12DC66
FTGQYIKCARCKYLFQHAEKLIKKIHHIDKFGIIGLCDYCKDRIPCEHCYEVLKKFIASKNKETKKVNDFIQWLNNVKHNLKSNKLQSRSLSNLHLTKQRNFTLDPKIIHELRRDQFSDTETSRNTVQTESQQNVSTIVSFNGTPVGGDKAELVTDKIKRYFFDTDSNLIEHSDVRFRLQKRKELKFPSKYTHISQDGINVNVHDLDLVNLLHRKDINYHSFNNSEDKFSDNLPFKYDYTEKSNLSRSPTEIRENVEEKKTNISPTDLHSQDVLKFGEGISQGSLQKDFSFVFIKPINKQPKIPSKYKSSSELIKDTKDMIRERSEKEKTLREIKLKEKNINFLKVVSSKPKKKKETLEETKEIVLLDDDQKIHDIDTEKLTTEEPTTDKKEKESVNKLSHKLPKSEKEKMKIDQKKKIDDKDLMKVDKVATKVKKETEKQEKYEKLTTKVKKETEKQEKDEKISTKVKKETEKQEKDEKVLTQVKKETQKQEKVEKNVIEKEQKVRDSEKKTKKEPSVDLNKKEDLSSEKKQPKHDANKGSSTKDNIDEFKKLLAEQKKQNEEAEKLRKKEEEEKKRRNEEEEKKRRKEEEEKKRRNEEEEKRRKKEEEEKRLKDSAIKRQGEKEPKSEKKSELKSKSKVDANQIKIRTPSTDDLILQLVRLKQSQHTGKQRVQPKRLSELNIDPTVIKTHRGHLSNKQSNCVICNDSELELDIENIDRIKCESKEVTDIIIGQQIFKYKPHTEENINKTSIGPILFATQFNDDVVKIPSQDLITNSAAGDMERKPVPGKIVEQEVPKGIIRYALSDRTFIDKGWTMLPTEKVVRKMNVYRMRPAHPEFDWFEHNKNKKLMHYDTGEKLAEFDDDGRGRWFYRNGKLALDYYDAKEINAQQRFVIYSSGEPDERGRSRPLAILATFDYLGNGIVFDHAGKIRLKYNQTEGVVLDRSIGPVSHWKWHTLNDPPVLQQVMIDTQMAHKDPEIFKLGGPGDDKVRPDNEEMLAIEFDNFIKEKSKKLSQKFKPFQIKMKALKINEHFSLKVLDQATVYLIFRDGSINLKINIGMILDHKEIVDTDTAEVGEVSNSLERFPARTDSLAGLQKSVAYAQRVERARVERERRLRPTVSYTDKVNAIVSRPLRTPLDRLPPSSTGTVTTSAYNCRCRKSSSCQLYYDTRLT